MVGRGRERLIWGRRERLVRWGSGRWSGCGARRDVCVGARGQARPGARYGRSVWYTREAVVDTDVVQSFVDAGC